MIRNFNYLNKKNEREIKFEYDDQNKIIAIYGKNGVGKTTFSKSTFWDQKYVFNEDFVRKNIYVTSDEGIKATTNNNKNLSLLFMGDEIIKLQNKVELLDLNLKEYRDKSKAHIKDIQSNFKTRIAESIIKDQLEKYLNQISEINPYISYDVIEKDIKDKLDIKVDTCIFNEDTFTQKMKIFDSQDKVQLFIKYLQQDVILSKVFISENNLISYYELIDSIVNLSTLLKQKNLISDFYKERNVNGIPSFKFISDLLRIQGSNKNCVICGTSDKGAEISKWKKVLENEYEKEKTKKLKQLESILNTVKNIEVIKEQLVIEIPKSLDFLSKIKIEVESIIDKLKMDDLDIKSDLSMEKLEEITRETGSILLELVTYLISLNKELYIGTLFQISNVSNEISSVKTDLNNKMNVQKETIMEDMNEILAKMQVDRTIQVKVSRSGGKYKYSYTVDDKEVSILSEGQRHKLALAFFIVSVKLLGLKDKTIVLDDPVISLDELGYHILKKLIIDLRRIEDSLCIVVLTHNIFYLYIQLSNVFHNDDLRKITSFYRMTETEISQFELDILRLDDLSLFKRSLSIVDSEDRLLILGGIVPKIFRQMLDIKVRMRGLLYLDKPSEDIQNLELEELIKNKLLEINRKINKISKKISKFTSAKAILLIELLEEATTHLGFENYVTNEEVKKLSDYSGDKLITENLNGDDLMFDMLDAVNDVLYRGKLPELKAYIAHPRQQITKQITSLNSDFQS